MRRHARKDESFAFGKPAASTKGEIKRPLPIARTKVRIGGVIKGQENVNRRVLFINLTKTGPPSHAGLRGYGPSPMTGLDRAHRATYLFHRNDLGNTF